MESMKEEESTYDEEGNETKTVQKKTKKKLVHESPTIDPVSRSDIVYDPRYIRLEDFPAIIETKRGIRMSFFTKNPTKYLNVDKLKDIKDIGFEDQDSYREQILSITGIQYNGASKVDTNNLTVKKFYGRYEMGEQSENDGSGEKLYEFWTINDMLLVYAEEISQLPFQDFRCFPDTETFNATGFLEPIL